MNKKGMVGVLIFILALMVSGCIKQPYEPSGLITMPPELISEIEIVSEPEQELNAIIQIEEEIISLENDTNIEISIGEVSEAEKSEEELLSKISVEDIPQELPPGVFKKITSKEKDMVSLSINAQDPDGNQLLYEFSEPFSEDGIWQTKRGDAGEYIVNITVSDGDLSTTAKILVVVESINKVPVVDAIDSLTVNEGDMITLEPKATDENEDTVVFSFSGWMDSNSYQVSYNSVVCEKGVYDCLETFTTTVTASDGFSEVSQDVEITVTNTNRAPALDAIEDITVDEEGLVTVEAVAADLDGDELTLSFTSPLDDEGKLQTERGDAGSYIIYITASDGDLSTSEKITLTINSINEDPILGAIDDLTIDETDTITLSPAATDANDDEVTFTYSGFMSSNTYTTTYDDAGTHIVTVTATDMYGGQDSTDVTIIVNNVNRAPVIIGVY
ncbi:hypothetical protein KY313_02815 [Candidatus Woesearchaeota archaeon]|nr:hypothetical protein [Candidatus Woesearchaeota archaeon]